MAVPVELYRKNQVYIPAKYVTSDTPTVMTPTAFRDNVSRLPTVNYHCMMEWYFNENLPNIVNEERFGLATNGWVTYHYGGTSVVITDIEEAPFPRYYQWVVTLSTWIHFMLTWSLYNESHLTKNSYSSKYVIFI